MNDFENLRVRASKEGTFLIFMPDTGPCAAIQLERLAAREGGQLGHAILNWCAEVQERQRQDNNRKSDTELLLHVLAEERVCVKCQASDWIGMIQDCSFVCLECTTLPGDQWLDEGVG